MVNKLEKKNSDLIIRAERCTGCMNCQLICSFTYNHAFNPSMARIIISGEDEKKIWFTEECTGCHLCTKYCVYGAIVLKEKEE